MNKEQEKIQELKRDVDYINKKLNIALKDKDSTNYNEHEYRFVIIHEQIDLMRRYKSILNLRITELETQLEKKEGK